MNSPQELLEPRTLKYIILVLLTVGSSIFVYSLCLDSQNTNHILDLRDNLGALTKHVLQAYGPTFTDNQQNTTQLSTRGFHAQMMYEIQEARQTIEELRNRVDFLEKINYDKFGKTDYASADYGGKVLSVEPKQRSWVVWSFVERVLRIGRKSQSNRNCCIIQKYCPGKCYAYPGSSASITIKLMGKVWIEGVTVEHVRSNVLPDLSTKSAMKEFSVWGLDSTYRQNYGFFFGNFVFDAGADFMHSFNFTLRSPKSFEYVRFNVASNHGADYTCIYRIRVHGTLDVKSKA